MDNDKYKEKLLLTNVKNVKNGQYYDKVTEELKERSSEREEEFPLNVAQTRQTFKRCINICRDIVIKVKTSCGVKRFQDYKELGSWFGELLPIISLMNYCQPQHAIEPERKTPETKSEEANPERAMMMMFAKKRQVKALPHGPLMGYQMDEGNMYLHE